jgi:LmbE family N-acetylglucosaminyl deacetylase
MSEHDLRKVAMVVMAHQDDAEFDGAGTVALWVSEGWQVFYVICADGGSGGPDEATDVGPVARQKIVETREQEQRAAARVLGVQDVFFLRYPDGQLQPSLDLRRDLVRLFRMYRPSRVICQSPERNWFPNLIIQRYHSDHLVAGQAALAAIYPTSQNPWDFPELLADGLLPHKISEIYIVAAPVQNFFVDISSTFELKLQALRAHESQVGADFAELEQLLRSIGAEIGQKYGVAYAEEFHRVLNE